MSTDASGKPTKVILTGGQRPDCNQALPLLAGQWPKTVFADKGYDADTILEAVHALGAEAVIPPRRHRVEPIVCDYRLYKERNKIERMFGRLKQFRRVATRYDKLAEAYLAFVLVASIRIWLS